LILGQYLLFYIVLQKYSTPKFEYFDMFWRAMMSERMRSLLGGVDSFHPVLLRSA
jgi:hypothetical protein